MASLRLTSEKTLPIIIEALARIQFTQTELSVATKVSIGRVNKIISWLKDKEMVTKVKGKYLLSQPNRLTDMVADQHQIIKFRTYYVSSDRSKLLAMLKKKSQICLETALEEHGGPKQQSIQAIYDETIEEELNKLPRGELQVILYQDKTNTTKGNTNFVKTIIDLKSIGKGYLCESLAAKEWGTRQ